MIDAGVAWKRAHDEFTFDMTDLVRMDHRDIAEFERLMTRIAEQPGVTVFRGHMLLAEQFTIVADREPPRITTLGTNSPRPSNIWLGLFDVSWLPWVG